jgi:hypothetical protein
MIPGYAMVIFFVMGVLVGGLLTGAVWSFWTARKLTRLRLAGELDACRILMDKEHFLG